MSKVIWKPQAKQQEFMSRGEYEALYGGAAGGGKSDALVVEALRQVDIPHYKGLIIRRTYPQLKELIGKSLSLYPRVYPRAKYNATAHTWTFPSGATVEFGSMHTTKDKEKYQGQAYDFIAFDELTHFTQEEYMYLYSRNRANGPGTRLYIRATANPGGIGHGWVKERFITPAPPLTTIRTDVNVNEPGGKVIKLSRTRVFVPSTVFDNLALLANSPEYLANLAMLPEAEKKALLYGNWNSFSGQVFVEWKNDPEHYQDRQYTHVIEPFRVPDDWRIYRGFDWGYSRPFSVGWYAVDYERRIYRIREFYGCTGTPNEGVKMTAQEIAKGIKQIEDEDPNLKGKKIIGIADPSIFAENGGESYAEQMEKYYVHWEKGDNTRLAGKMQFHYRFAFDEDGVPMMYIFNTCKHFIRTIPNLIYSERDVEDIDTDGEDHIYDECRYVLMENPVQARKNNMAVQRASDNDPLDLREKRNKKYDFYLMK